MSEYFSTQTSIENLISASRLVGFIDQDGDGSPDAGALESGQKAARGLIRGALKRDYDTDEIDSWSDAELTPSCPELIGYISDCLCVQVYYKYNPQFQAVAKEMYDQALQTLKDIRNGDMDIYELDRATTHLADLIVTERIASDADPERDLDDMTVRTTWVLPDSRDIEGY